MQRMAVVFFIPGFFVSFLGCSFNSGGLPGGADAGKGPGGDASFHADATASMTGGHGGQGGTRTASNPVDAARPGGTSALGGAGARQPLRAALVARGARQPLRAAPAARGARQLYPAARAARVVPQRPADCRARAAEPPVGRRRPGASQDLAAAVGQSPAAMGLW